MNLAVVRVQEEHAKLLYASGVLPTRQAGCGFRFGINGLAPLPGNSGDPGTASDVLVSDVFPTELMVHRDE